MAARCEDFHAIDLASLRRLKAGHVSSINWSRAGHLTGQISIEVDSQCACLTYRHRQIGGAWQEAREVVSFTETGTCFGGRRRWFECPGCGRPCRMLYGGGRFLCRLCLRLRYASQYESAWGRARIRAQKLRMRLGGSPNAARDSLDYALFFRAGLCRPQWRSAFSALPQAISHPISPLIC
jgi:hypothetical protein